MPHTPDHHAEIFFGSASRSGTLKIGVFSSGDKDFYPHLVDVIEKCESRKGIVAEVRSILDGMLNYMPDFDPSVVANESSYDKSSANSQWASQNPLGMQTILQFEVKAPQVPLKVGDKVLGNIIKHPLTGKWYPATVASQNKDGTYDLAYHDGQPGERETGCHRYSIRKWESAGDIAVSEVVLAISNDDDGYFVGKVLEKLPHNKYKVHIHDGKGSIDVVNGINMMKRFERFETPAQLPPPEASCAILEEMLQKAANAHDLAGKEKVQSHSGTGDGCVATALWSKGSAIVTWDGGDHVDLNLFTFEEDKQMHGKFPEVLLEMMPSFVVVSHSDYPRGFGRVVNFKHEMKPSSKYQ